MFHANHAGSTESLSTPSSEKHLAKQIAIQDIQIEKLHEQLDRQTELLQAYQAQICQLKQELSQLKHRR